MANRSHGASAIAGQLIDAMFPCKPFLAIDTIVVVSLFGQRTDKVKSRVHDMLTFDHQGLKGVNPEINDLLYSAFETHKGGLLLDNVISYAEAIEEIAKIVYRPEGFINIHGPRGRSIFKWCVAAYAMVINPASTVKLSCIRMGPQRTYGFTIHAKKPIKKGAVIYELIGLMPRDNNARYVDISTIKPSKFNNQSPKKKRALCGPIRYINHICKGANVEFLGESGTSAFFAGAMRDIKQGEGLFLDYGAKWFEKEPGGCPCIACKPDQQQPKPQQIGKPPEVVEAEIRAARTARLANKRVKKRLGKANAMAGA